MAPATVRIKRVASLGAAFAAGVSLSATPPAAAGSIVNPVWGVNVPLPVDKAAWSVTMDCANDMIQVRGENVAAGSFELLDGSYDSRRVLRSASATRSGTKTIAWNVPFVELRADSDYPEYRSVLLSRGKEARQSWFLAATLSARETCRGLRIVDINRSYEGQIKGSIPDTLKKGRKYRLPSTAVGVYPELNTWQGPVSYRVKTLPATSKTRVCRIVSGERAQYIVGLKAGHECLLRATSLSSIGKFVSDGPVAVIRVVR